MSQTLPLLYKRTSTGAVQSWSIEVDKNKFRVTSGQIDGKQVTSEWTVCDGKNLGRANETTPEDQALAEAQSKHEKKSKTGYTIDIKKIDSCTSYVEPMLAKNLKDRLDKIDWKKGVLVQNKFNGARCVATFNGTEVELKSRKGELYVSCPHINKDLEKFFAKYPDAVLDGELFNNDLRQKLNEIMKLIRKTVHATSEELANSAKLVSFFVYDGWGFSDDLDESTPYEDRKAWIDANLPKFSKTFRSVETKEAYSMADVDTIFGEYISDGQEGVIVRIKGSGYDRKRSASLLKYKPLDDMEGTIIKLHEGEGNWASTAKTATLKLKNGVEVDATFMGSFEQGQERLKNPKSWMNKEVTFMYNGFTGKGEGKPNYARIDPDNCFKGDN